MALQPLGPGGIAGNMASDVKIDEFLQQSEALLKKYQAVLDSNMKLLQAYFSKGGKEDLGLAMIGQQLKALNKQVEEASKGEREVTEKFTQTMDKRLASTVKAIEDYADANVNPKFTDERQAQINERMERARAAKATKAAQEATEENIEVQTRVAEAVEELAETAKKQVEVSTLSEAEASKARRSKILKDRENARKRMSQDRRDAALAKLGKKTSFADRHEDAITTVAEKTNVGASSAIKVALSAALGPASPIVNVLDNLIGFDKMTAKLGNILNPFKKKEADEDSDPQLGALAKLRLTTQDAMDNVRDTVRNGFEDLIEATASAGRKTDRFFANQKYNGSLLLDRLKDLKPKEKGASLLSGLGGALKSGFGLVSGWLSKIAAALGMGALTSKLRGLLGKGGGLLSKGKGVLAKGGGLLAKGKGVLGAASKVLGPVAGALGAYEVGSNFWNGPQEGAKDRSALTRGFDYGSGALSGAAAGAAVGSIIPVVGTAVGGAIGAAIGTASVAWKEYGQDIIDGVTKLGADGKAWLAKSWDKASEAARRKVDEATKLLTTSIDDLGKWMSGLGDSLAKKRDQAMQWLGKTATNVKDSTVAWVQRKASEAREVGVAARNLATAGAQRVGEVATNVKDYAVSGAKKVSQKAMDFWNGGAKQDIVGAAAKANVDAGTLAKIAHFESKFDANAAPIAGQSRAHLNKVKLHDGRMGISSAHGYGQFIDGTWEQSIRKYGDKYGVKDAKNLSKAEIAKLRGDKSLQASMLAEFTRENIEKGRALGGSDDDANVYAFHNLGEGDATSLLKGLKQNPDMSVRDALKAGKSSKDHARIESVIKGNSSLYGDGNISVKEAYAKMGGHMRAGEVFAEDARKLQASMTTPVEIPSQKGSIVPPKTEVAAKSGSTKTEGKTQPMGGSLAINQIPMFVNDIGLLQINTHGVL